MVAEGIPELVVFEDDARPDPRFADSAAGPRQACPTDLDVVTFHSLFDWSSPVPVGSPPLLDDFRVCRYARTPMGTQAYLITLERRPAGARRRVTRSALPADELLFRRRPAGLRVYGIEPTLITHEEFRSEVRAPAPPVALHGRGARAGLEVVRLAGKVRRRVERHRPAFTPKAG